MHTMCVCAAAGTIKSAIRKHRIILYWALHCMALHSAALSFVRSIIVGAYIGRRIDRPNQKYDQLIAETVPIAFPRNGLVIYFHYNLYIYDEHASKHCTAA